MSEAPRHALISTPRQLITVVIAAFAIPIIAIMLIISYIENTNQANAGKDATSNEAVARRIEPVAHVVMAPPAAPAPAPAAAASGAAAAPETAAASASNASAGVTQPGATSANNTQTPPVAPAAGATAAAGTGAATAAGTGATAAASTGITSAGAGAGTTASTAAAPTANPAPAPASATTPATAGAAPAADTQLAGKTLYTQVCQACHAAGVLGAPKFGDKAAWAPRLKDPMDVVYGYALHGKGAMPPKGGSNASDADVKAAVDYMVNAAK